MGYLYSDNTSDIATIMKAFSLQSFWPTGTILRPANVGGVSNSAYPTGGSAAFVPFVIPKKTTLTAFTLGQVTAGAGAAARLSLYADNGGVPDALLADAGEVDLSTSGNNGTERSAGVSLLVAPGIYWGLIQTKATATPATLVRNSGAFGNLVVSPAYAATAWRYYSGTVSYGASPTTAPSVSADAGSNGFWMGLRN